MCQARKGLLLTCSVGSIQSLSSCLRVPMTAGVQVLCKAIQQDPRNPLASLERAHVLMQYQRYPDALQELEALKVGRCLGHCKCGVPDCKPHPTCFSISYGCCCCCCEDGPSSPMPGSTGSCSLHTALEKSAACQSSS